MYNQNLIDQGKHFGKCYFRGNINKLEAKWVTVIMRVFPSQFPLFIEHARR